MEKSPSPIAAKEMSLKQKTSIEVPIVNNKTEHETKAEASEVLNEEPNEKSMKVSEVMTNMDPLEYFSRFLDLPEMVFRHFKGKDLITISEVSPSWYDFIASSKLLVENIQVVFGKNRTIENSEDLATKSEGINCVLYTTSSKDLMKIKVGFHDECDPEDYNLLKNSSRLYQNIKVNRSRVLIKDENGIIRRIGDFVTNSELDFFYSKAHEWKNVSLDNVYFRKKMDLWELLSAIEATVESFSVRDFGALSFEDPSSKIESFKALKFLKLKKLKMTFNRYCSIGDIWARFFLNSVAIEELDLGDRSDKVGKEILTKMLENFDKLTSLYIDSLNINLIFEDESWRKFQFKLKSLTVLFFIRYNWLGSNFRNFLKSQSDHLEELSIQSEVINRETLDVIMKMPRLKSFNLKITDDFSENEVPIKVSTSITELTLLNNANAISIKFLLNSMPKINHLTLDSISESDFKMLKSMKRKFESLKVGKLIGVDRKEIEEIMTEKYTSLEIVKSV